MNSRITNKEEISDLAFELLKENMDAFSKIRLIGLSASNFEVEKLDRDIAQMKLFE